MAGLTEWKQFLDYEIFVDRFYPFSYGCIYESIAREKVERGNLAMDVLRDVYTNMKTWNSERISSIEDIEQYLKTAIFYKATGQNNAAMNDPFRQTIQLDIDMRGTEQYLYESRNDLAYILSLVTKKFGAEYAEIAQLIGEGYSNKEIGVLRELPEGTVRRRMFTIRVYLKGYLKNKR